MRHSGGCAVMDRLARLEEWVRDLDERITELENPIGENDLTPTLDDLERRVTDLEAGVS